MYINEKLSVPGIVYTYILHIPCIILYSIERESGKLRRQQMGLMGACNETLHHSPEPRTHTSEELSCALFHSQL